MGNAKPNWDTITNINHPDSYVLITAASFYALSIWLGARINSFRQAAKVLHPGVYASTETIANASSAREKRSLYLFNCAQRAHHNVLENYTAALTGMLISGLKYPTLAAAFGAAWVFGRVVYTLDYSSASEKNVYGKGRFFWGGFHVSALSQVGFLVLVGKIGVDLLTASDPIPND
jgi:glutathione S-transferase